MKNKLKAEDLIKSGKAHAGALKWLRREFDRVETAPQYEQWNGTSYDLMKLIVQGIYVADTWKGTSYAVPEKLRIRAANVLHGYHLYAIKKLKGGIPIFGHTHDEDFGITQLKSIDCRAPDHAKGMIEFTEHLPWTEADEGKASARFGLHTKAQARRIKKMLQRTVLQLEKLV